MNNKLLPIGTAALPENIRQSRVLTTANINLLGSVMEMPVVDPSYYDDRLKTIFQYYSINPDEMEIELQHYAKELLDKGDVVAAWQVLLSIAE